MQLPAFVICNIGCQLTGLLSEMVGVSKERHLLDHDVEIDRHLSSLFFFLFILLLHNNHSGSISHCGLNLAWYWCCLSHIIITYK